ncbi:non-hydrolyzing UDP-N-acetylglucosamine 2-epimerase [Brevibacterium aurantiacum]|uniref:UDP-N-acetylglucosamine 2-epimerase (non-hydrolyzing) n=1 Tax=Brevibacterium aurantiacum TaxID=273384 RepID=A0A2H1JCM7_BREAU|nr:UDP-N-acetylglucosamine 2-epimerase (non-hydrolyzing) [Brevibacterium aurantiacum]SMX85088.1 UDP-N-acetylglucosamine 2-epimerase (non-hydrolysing) [Brevibacterium aurantiacum]
MAITTKSRLPRIVVIYGTRPEAIKLAPIVKVLQDDSLFEPIVVVTGQHREMLDQVNQVFDIEPHVNLDIMSHGQTLNEIASSVVSKIDGVLAEYKPDFVIVQGDTTTVMGAAIAAFNCEVPVVHLEAGLRSGDINSPFPEEANRRIVSQIASVHLAPSSVSRSNLLANGVRAEDIHVIGNTVIDALHWAIAQRSELTINGLSDTSLKDKLVLLVTTHRRENLGANMREIGRALKELALKHSNLVIVWPAHKNPQVRAAIIPEIEAIENVVSIEPVDYGSFCQLLSRSDIVLTDSGGIQEEAPSLGKPVLVLRENTERPEAVAAGTAKLIGTDERRIVSEVSNLIDNTSAYSAMANAVNPYGDGNSAPRTLAILKRLVAR